LVEKSYVILPVHNESKSIYNLLSNFSEFCRIYGQLFYEIIIVNDNSQDDSEDYIFKAVNDFKNLNINYHKHNENKGLPGSLLTGFSLLKDMNDNSLIITMDGDNTHNPFLVSEMINKIHQGADIVIASRYCEQSRIYGLSEFRIFLSNCAKFLYRLFFNINGVRDYTSNYRAYRGYLIKNLLKENTDGLSKRKSFTVTVKILRKMLKYKPKIVEVPMILNYSNKLQVSNMKVFSTILQSLALLISKND